MPLFYPGERPGPGTSGVVLSPRPEQSYPPQSPLHCALVIALSDGVTDTSGEAQIPADEEDIQTGAETSLSDLIGCVSLRDGRHLQVIGDHHPFEAEFAPE